MLSEQRPSPEQLLREARAGPGDSLGRLLELYRNYLYLVARTQIDLHLQAQVSPSDLVQETFLEAYRDFGQFDGVTEAQLLAWLRRILLHNLAQLVQRLHAAKRNVRRQVSLELSLRTLEDSAARMDRMLLEHGSTPSARAQRREEAALLADQLARLPSPYRDVIILRNLEGLPFNEVAERMGRLPGAVRVLWLRALNRLRQLLKEEDLI
jgi:RNA polymerase sigma-70 factor (ECF subfamily)